jgi:PadR family transcriptional regulator PadR
MLNSVMARNRQPSKQMRILLDSLSGQRLQWRHGYDLMKETGLSSGTLYPLLMR